MFENYTLFKNNFGIQATDSTVEDRVYSIVIWTFKTVVDRDKYLKEIEKSEKYSDVTTFNLNREIIFK